MRGISAIIAVVLILLITVSLAAGAYLFLSMTMSQTTTAAQQGISQTMTQMTKSFAIEAVDGPRISIRNTGQAQLSNFSVYVDNNLVNTSQVSIAPDEVKTILIYDFVDFSRPRELKVVTGSLAQTKIVSKQDSTLVGYWKFDEGTGTTAADSSGNGNDGTLVNGPTWIDGKYGKALTFDGVNDYVLVPKYGSNFFGSGPFTIEAWINANNVSSYRPVVCSGDPNSQPATNFWVVNSKVRFVLRESGATDYKDVYSNSILSLGNWYHIVAVRDGSNMTIFLNGKYDNSISNGPTGNVGSTNYYLYIGKLSYGTLYFNGTIDEVRIYNRALSADEIWNHYVHGPV
jgi:flagellin-like protein